MSNGQPSSSLTLDAHLKSRLDNMSAFNKMIGRREIHELRNFVESFNSDDAMMMSAKR